MKKVFQYGSLVLFLAFAGMQFFQVDQTNPTYKSDHDFFAVEQVDARSQSILKNACYDCHSNETVYPWYTVVQPMGWRISEHVEHGREHLNFSDWGMLPRSEKEHALHEIVEVMEEEEMPLKDYTLLHAEARLSDDDRNHLILFVKNLN